MAQWWEIGKKKMWREEASLAFFPVSYSPVHFTGKVKAHQRLLDFGRELGLTVLLWWSVWRWDGLDMAENQFITGFPLLAF